MLEALGGGQPPATLVETLFGETEGNPFFVEEVYEHLAEEGRLFDDKGEWREDLTLDELDVPEGVRLVVGRRLERLDEDGRRILSRSGAGKTIHLFPPGSRCRGGGRGPARRDRSG